MRSKDQSHGNWIQEDQRSQFKRIKRSKITENQRSNFHRSDHSFGLGSQETGPALRAHNERCDVLFLKIRSYEEPSGKVSKVWKQDKKSHLICISTFPFRLCQVGNERVRLCPVGNERVNYRTTKHVDFTTVLSGNNPPPFGRRYFFFKNR